MAALLCSSGRADTDTVDGPGTAAQLLGAAAVARLRGASAPGGSRVLHERIETCRVDVAATLGPAGAAAAEREGVGMTLARRSFAPAPPSPSRERLPRPALTDAASERWTPARAFAQLCTGLVYRGPGLVRGITKAVAARP